MLILDLTIVKNVKSVVTKTTASVLLVVCPAYFLF